MNWKQITAELVGVALVQGGLIFLHVYGQNDGILSTIFSMLCGLIGAYFLTKTIQARNGKKVANLVNEQPRGAGVGIAFLGGVLGALVVFVFWILIVIVSLFNSNGY